MQSGLKLISSDHDVVKLVEVHQDVPVVELYLVSFAERRPNANDCFVGDEAEEVEAGEHGRIDRDDSYWDEVNEPDLFDEDNDVGGPSTEWGGEGGEGVRVMRVMRDDDETLNRVVKIVVKRVRMRLIR
ncbi:hypothetical protein SLA2020_431990 [Shorea laevis]